MANRRVRSWFKKNVTRHSSLSFHHSSLKISHPVWHHHSLVITQYFSTICGSHTCILCSFYFFFFFLQPPVPKLTEPSEKKKKKKPRNSNLVKEEGKKKRTEELKTKLVKE